jgi:hypothetical protein
MDAIIKQVPGSGNFWDYIGKENKTYSLTILGLMLAEFVIFKSFYPYPDFFSDSYSYILAADLHFDVNIWPIGYSRFLALFHWFSHSGFALTMFQYLAYALSALYFYHTITYFYHTGKNTRIFLCVFLFFNPIFLYLANYVTSDMLFVSMSTVWLAQLIWILQRPKLYQVFVQGILMFIMFTFRYNAMIYPVIAAGVFLLSKQRAWIKVLGIVIGPVLILPFIIWSSNAAKKMTGTPQFPPILGGWQWGNNALYMRGFIEVDSNIFPTPETTELDRIARKYFGQPSRPQDQLSSYVANFFIRQPEAPLKQYMSRHFKPKGEYEYVQAWGKSAVVFDRYGKLLVKKYPFSFARYYLLVNAKNYFIPPLEKLEIYNLGDDKMWEAAQYWFQYPSPNVWCISKTLQGTLLAFFPFFFLVLNGYYLVELIRFTKNRGWRSVNPTVQYTLLTVTVFLGLNAAFSVFANIIVIRYQIFPMLAFLTFAMLLTDCIEIIGKSRLTNDPVNKAQIKQAEGLSVTGKVINQ